MKGAWNSRFRMPSMASKAVGALRTILPPLNFITLHYIYYISVCLISAIIFWGSSTPPRSISFTDSIFLCISAMTQAGLNTVNLSEVNTFQQFILFFLILIGSGVLISSVVVHTRKKAFEQRFAGAIEEELKRKRALRSISRPFTSALSRRRTGDQPPVDGVVVRGRAIKPQARELTEDGILHSPANPGDHPPVERSLDTSSEQPYVGPERTLDADDEHDLRLGTLSTKTDPTVNSSGHIRFAQTGPSSPAISHRRVLTMSGVGARPDIENHPRTARHPLRPASARGDEKYTAHFNNTPSTSKYFDSDGHIDRNSQFHSLSSEERERLGGVEYSAVRLLERIIIAYYILFQLLGCIGLGAWVALNRPNVTSQNALNPWWVGAFNAVSAFNNSGMSLLDANMVAFQDSVYMLMTMGLLILAGNTCYPVFLRLILWTLLHIMPSNDYFADQKRTIRFLLDHPRRCYTNLFPFKETWWLLGSLIVLNGIDWIGFEVLNLGNDKETTGPNAAVPLDGLFQALAVRSGGFYVVPIANLRIGLLVLYVLMMYISVYPVTITIRNSNVYEERSLGIYSDDPSLNSNGYHQQSIFRSVLTHIYNFNHTDAHRSSDPSSRSYFVRQQLRGQLAHDLWWICVAVFLITIIETSSFERDPLTFSVFNIVFETVSGYGCVGISTGAPNVAFSFCGTWHVLSKLILCAVMLRGRHRGLPVAIDRAVLLPGEHLGAAEEEDAVLRRERTLERREGKRREEGGVGLV